MSFSSDVKRELANVECESCCLKAELYAIIKFKATIKLSFGGLGVSISTTQNAIARRIVYLFKKIYNVKLDIIAYKQQKLDKKTLYVLDVSNVINILIDLKILNEDNTFNQEINKDIYKNECCKSSLVRGAFLVMGSVNDPNTSNYHLEIKFSEMNDAEVVRNILEDVMVYPKIIESKNVYKLYLKKAEQIRDFLNYIGAINNLFAFEDSRIKRDYNNYVNRIINCDIANEEKVIKNAKKQIEQIKYLQKHYGFSHLTPRLMDAVILRNTFPDYSLSGLSDESFETLGRYISKSGLSHCFKDIEKLYLDIKAKKEQ